MKKPATLAIKLSKIAEKQVKSGHPWVFESSIEKPVDSENDAGSLCVIFDRHTNRPFAFGLWDPDEVIRIKILETGNSLKLNNEFWESRLNKAYEIRKPLLKSVNGYRALNGENDGFPGLILDVYNQTAVLKIYSTIWQPYLSDLIELIQYIFKVIRIVIRFSRKLLINNNYEYNEGQIIGEELSQEKIPFQEYGISFYAYPVSGHKTGFFLDQRPNRYWVQKNSNNKKVLDVFSYVGGFGLHALKGGASSLTSIDISKQAMTVAEENMKLNDFGLKRWTPVAADAFDAMHQLIEQNQKFDLVIIDPPSFAKKASEVPAALKQYRRLAEIGSKLTTKNGILILGSCSSRVSADDFREVHRQAFSGSDWQLFKETGHDIDHPANFAEAVYLKTFYYKRK